MGKTKRHSIDPEYIKKKIRRLQRKLEHQEETSTSPQRSTSPEPITLPPPPPSQQPTQPLPPTQPPPSITNPEQGTSTEGNIEQIPEEFLAALGNEGEEKVEEGEPIQSELATRWMRIMAEGLTKEQIQTLVKKYPTPKNFPAAVAPILNKEIGATLSELSLNRDRRIINRQNMIAKILSCLGMALTDILKGNINSKKLIEQISDAAKIAAEIHCNDSKSRKFFALSSATKIVQDACKETKTGKLLFGDGLSDQLKTVQSVRRTAAQIQGTANKAPSTASKPLNWRGPSHYQTTNQRGRGGQRPTRRPTTNQTPRRPAPTRGKQTSRRASQRRY
ncbi:uncharacterized protein isoform X2 [Choristoneura fumiferana]|uniref:uncharacterized protein isoform X2 n=1 Tax=Choristoneura fumiferana TaxID=7141 RepID=UPI003D157799